MPAAFPHGHAVTRRLLAAACVIAALLALALAGGYGAGSPVGTAYGWGSNDADYDDDNDNLIDIRNLAQLNAVRWDLNGDGYNDSTSTANRTKYQAAFPNAASGMGCAAICAGYELRANLNFDTNGDGSTGAGDEFPDFRALGEYSATTFQGNGHTISNLSITKHQ